ncbi:Peptidyl-tRNA hydrolase [Candidatus Gugararchaeum adminiculabundum]|nr:Peptidyl-tRNA hydrolase [Candidatus Gugararchaeum adminiculabundum]
MAEVKQVIVVRNDLNIGKGKIAAHVAHASLEAYKKAKRENPELVEQWEEGGQKKIVVKVESEREIVELFEMAKKQAPAALIKDAGHTQVEPGTIIALGIGPAEDAIIDKFTSKLKLL